MPPHIVKISDVVYSDADMPMLIREIYLRFKQCKDRVLKCYSSCLFPQDTNYDRSAYAVIFNIFNINKSLEHDTFRNYAAWMMRTGMHMMHEIIEYYKGDVLALHKIESTPFIQKLRGSMPDGIEYQQIPFTSSPINELTVGVDFLIVIGGLKYSYDNKHIKF
jgi:hypothetical protein